MVGLEPLAESTVLGGLVPRTEYAASGGLPLTSAAFHDFRTHEPRIRIDGLSAPPGTFVARVPASIATAESCTGRGSISPAAGTVFASVLPYSLRAAKALAAATPIAQPTPLSRNSTRETDSAPTIDSTVSVSSLLGTPVPPSSTTRRTATATGIEPRCRLWIRARQGPSTICPECQHPPASPMAAADPAPATPALADSPVRRVPLLSDHDHAKPMGTPLLRLTPSPGDTPTAPTRSDVLGDAAELRFAYSVPHFSHADGKREQHVEPTCHATMRYISIGRPSILCRPTFWRATPRTSVLPSQTSRS